MRTTPAASRCASISIRRGAWPASPIRGARFTMCPGGQRSGFRRPHRRIRRTGDVVVARPTLLAAGVVVDDEGHPVDGRPDRAHEAGGWRPSTRDHHLERRRPVRASRRDGTTPGSPSPLSASGWICLTPTLCDRGAQDIRVVMTRAGGIAGTIAGIDRLRRRLQPPVQVVVAGPGVDAVTRVVGGSHPAGMELPVFSTEGSRPRDSCPVATRSGSSASEPANPSTS